MRTTNATVATAARAARVSGVRGWMLAVVADFAEVNPVDIREEHIAGGADGADLVLDVEGYLEVVAPVAALVAVVRQHGVIEENLEAVEVGPEPVQDDDVGRDDEEVARQRRVGFVELVEKPRSSRSWKPCRSARRSRYAGATSSK